MLYEIVNPSDHYTIHCPDLEIATIACCLLGGGQYGFQALDGGEDVPLFLFGGVEQFCAEHFGSSFEETMRRVKSERLTDLVAALDSVLIGKREAFEKATATMTPKQRLRARAAWHKKELSSTNDIGQRAWTMAERLRASAEAPLPAAPRQVFTS